MGATKLLTAGGGGVTLDAASTATDKTITVPADNGTLIYANSSGNVGIGTSSPTEKVTSSNGFLSTGAVSSFARDGAFVDYSSSYSRFVAGRAGGNYAAWQSYVAGASGVTLRHQIDYDSTYRWYAADGTTERMRLDSSGNLLVGTTSTIGSATGVLQVKGAASQNAIQVQIGTNGNNGVLWYNASASAIGSIVVNSGSVAYNTTSDYRLKENIAPMTGALAKVSALKPCTYTWKATGEQTQGFIAHELQAVVPDCVTGEKDAVDAEGNPVYQGIDTSFLVATLTAAIQEQQALITSLTARIEALENK